MSATTITLALEVALQLLMRSQAISAMIAKAQAEGRTQLTVAEWDAVIAGDDQARQALVDAIAAAKGLPPPQQ